MGDFLKTALNYFNVDKSVISNDFVGQIVEVGNLKLRIKSLIAEGGFAFVYEAQDINQGSFYALKRLFGADKEACNNIIREITLHKQLSDHPNIVKFISASLVDRSKSTNGLAEYLLVTELCTGGSLLDYINEALDGETVLQIFYQASQAIKHLHFQNPPIVHRDIKIENFLLGADGFIKLCDFGSATTEIIRPDPSWNANARNEVEDKLATFTTPMYRAPEQLDTWENHIIGEKTDIWALGCILYLLCFRKHPFEDSAKLRIINGNYVVPTETTYKCFHSVIKGCLQTNPTSRSDISTILERLAAIAESLHWNLKGPIKLKSKANILSENEAQAESLIPDMNKINWQNEKHVPPERPQPPKVVRPPPPVQHNPVPIPTSNGLFSSLKGGAGSFLKNLKDTSSKVMQTVQQSITKTDCDISYITSRIMVMPCPSDGIESSYKTNSIETIKTYIESKYQPAKVSVYNFGPRSIPRLPPPIRTVEGSFIYFPTAHRSPSLNGLYSIVEDMYGFLCSDPKCVVIVQSSDGGRSVAATIIAALFIYANLITEPEDGIQMFAVKRMPPNMKPSELRYLYYLTDIVRSKPHLPHYKPINLVSLTIAPVPRMTKARDGCRLFIEISCNDKVLLSTLDDYDKMRLYHCTEESISVPLNALVCGDLCVSLYHARNTLAGMGGRPHGIKICQLQLNTGFVPEEETLISYDRQELDEITESDQYIANLNVSLSILVKSEERLPSVGPPWLTEKSIQRNPVFLFSSDLEFHENIENFVTLRKPKTLPSQPVKIPPTRPAPPAPHHSPLLHSTNTSNSTQPDLVQDTGIADYVAGETFDLLNLNQSEKQKSTFHKPTHAPAKELSFDLLGFGKSEDIENTSRTNSTTDNIDLLNEGTSINEPLIANIGFNSSTNNSKVEAKSFDPFENLLNANQPEPPKQSVNEIKSDPKISSDPFADLGSFVSNLTYKFTSDIKQTQQNLFGTTPNSLPNVLPNPSPNTSVHTTPTHQSRNMQDNISAQTKPDYNRSNFADTSKEPKATNSKNGGVGGGFGDMFADILGEQGYKFGNKTQMPRTINDMRKEDVIRDMDPDRIKIMEWTEGKKGNIRALLCSMHTILWAEAKWSKCDMHQLVSMADVKKAYRKACLAVHPDKHVGTENEEMSKMVFIELNNAWSDFENDSKQQNLF